MIVKDEKDVILRCLTSVKPFIDHWVIVDTGSQDGTQEIIKNCLKDIPGELHERPWVDFAHNRNEAASLARGKGDYLLFIDADDRLVHSKKLTLPLLKKDIYYIVQREADRSYVHSQNQREFLIKNNSDFEWHGVLHETVRFKKENISEELVLGIYIEYFNDGNRSKDPHRIEKDIALLKRGILQEPDNPHYYYFLGRTYWGIGDFASALPWFQMRKQLKGKPIESYQTLLYIAMILKHLGADHQTVLGSFEKAYSNRPTRAEPLYELAGYLMSKEQYFAAFLVCKHAMTLPMPKENMCLEPWVYEWGLALYFFLSSSQLQFAKEEARTVLRDLLRNPKLPQKVINDFELKKAVKFYYGI
jgi:glycosyltransferase involved in cell wall biosynthesis